MRSRVRYGWFTTLIVLVLGLAGGCGKLAERRIAQMSAVEIDAKLNSLVDARALHGLRLESREIIEELGEYDYATIAAGVLLSALYEREDGVVSLVFDPKTARLVVHAVDLDRSRIRKFNAERQSIRSGLDAEARRTLAGTYAPQSLSGVIKSWGLETERVVREAALPARTVPDRGFEAQVRAVRRTLKKLKTSLANHRIEIRQEGAHWLSAVLTLEADGSLTRGNGSKGTWSTDGRRFFASVSQLEIVGTISQARIRCTEMVREGTAHTMLQAEATGPFAADWVREVEGSTRIEHARAAALERLARHGKALDAAAKEQVLAIEAARARVAKAAAAVALTRRREQTGRAWSYPLTVGFVQALGVEKSRDVAYLFVLGEGGTAESLLQAAGRRVVRRGTWTFVGVPAVSTPDESTPYEIDVTLDGEDGLLPQGTFRVTIEGNNLTAPGLKRRMLAANKQWAEDTRDRADTIARRHATK